MLQNIMRFVRKLWLIFHKKPTLEEIAKRPLPNRFFRGLSSEKDFTPEGYITPSAFEFHDHTNDRDDNYWEASINWDDDEKALSTLMEQRSEKTNKLMFDKYVYLLLSQVRSDLSAPIEEKYFKYERRPLPNNIYHGNLLALGSLDKKTKNLFKSSLAMIATQNLKKMKKKGLDNK